MKNLIFAGCLLFMAFSCSEENLPIEEYNLNSSLKLSRSISTHLTPYINWENTSLININKIGNVTLPWYSGSKGAIPDFILNDYKKEDGWQLVYNFCSDTIENAEGGKNFIIFYNIISGKLRVFYYNNNFITTGTATIAQFKTDTKSEILNFNESVASIISNGTAPLQEVTCTNITTVPSKSSTLGWNCFDVLLSYDPATYPKYLHLGFYDQNIQNISLNGVLNMKTNGTVTSTSVSNPLTWLVDLAGEAAGDAAQKAWDEGIKSDKGEEITRGAMSGLVSGIVTRGIGKIFGSFIALFDKTDKKKSTIELTTDGKIDFNGSISSTQSAAIPSLQKLLLPGSTPDDTNQLLPHYNKPLGVWNIKVLPTIKIDDVLTGEFYSMPTPSYLPSNMYCYIADYYRKAEYHSGEIIINPELEKYIESYTVETQFFIVTKYNGIDYTVPNQFMRDCAYEYIDNDNPSNVTTQYWFPEEFVEFRYQNPNSPQFIFSQNDYNYVASQLKDKMYIEPTTKKPDNYIAKVILTINFKDNFERKQVVYSQTCKPSIVLREVERRKNPIIYSNMLKRTSDPNGDYSLRWEHTRYSK